MAVISKPVGRAPARVRSGWVAALVGLVLLSFLPNLFSEYIVYVAVLALLWAILAASFDLLFGYTGQLSFAHGAFYGIGAYMTALLTMRAEMSFWVALPIAMVAAALIGVVVGYPASRLYGAYLAVTTFFFSHFVYLVLLNWQDMTRGPLGLTGIQPPDPINLLGLGVLDFRNMATYYRFVLLCFALVMVVLTAIVRSRWGRMMVAVREDETLAQAIGVNTTLYKVLAFSIGAAFAGMAGGLYAHFIRILHPTTFAWLTSEMVVIMTIVGGMGTLIGPVLGAAVVTFILEVMKFAPELRFVVWALALIVVLLFEPRGLAGVYERLVQRWEGGRRPS